MIVRGGVGYDAVDYRRAAERAIPVCNVPDYGVDEVAAARAVAGALDGAWVAAVCDPSHEPTARLHALVAACSHEAEFKLSDRDALQWAYGVPVFVEVFDGEGGL